MIIANYTHLGDEITALTIDNYYHSLFPDLHNSAKSIHVNSSHPGLQKNVLNTTAPLKCGYGYKRGGEKLKNCNWHSGFVGQRGTGDNPDSSLDPRGKGKLKKELQQNLCSQIAADPHWVGHAASTQLKQRVINR